MNRTLLLVVAGLTALVIGGRMYLSTDSQPVSAGGAAIVSVSVPQLGEAERAGKAIFDENCAACHGNNAAGRDEAGPPLVHIIYEPGHHSDAAFYRAAQYGVRAHHWRFGDMPPVEGITEEEVAKIITYVRTLQRENGID
ncbi:MAG: cytochrome c [Alphaproteobacteria bacterium]|nr:cytochrome c [Alphaproteobacteria bacterium]